jgi:hypothetical protein
MDGDSFNDLALRVLAGEAADHERRALTAEISADPARLNELRTAVHRHFNPAAHRPKVWESLGLTSPLRWFFAGGGATALAAIAVLLVFSNRSIEVGLYGTDLMRGGDTSLSPADIPDAKLLTFDQDAPFDQWQSQPLAWYEHAKVWVDNENNMLNVVRREKHGHVIVQAIPLAPTIPGQRDQIRRVVESLEQ